MIRSILVILTLAKTVHDFIGFPRCKISKFSQDFQTIARLFFYCEENLEIAKIAQISQLPHNEWICLFPVFRKCFLRLGCKYVNDREHLIYHIAPSDDGYLYRLLFLYIWNVSDASIAFGT